MLIFIIHINEYIINDRANICVFILMCIFFYFFIKNIFSIYYIVVFFILKCLYVYILAYIISHIRLLTQFCKTFHILV